ncbi:MAG: alpha/beta fold hydrolase [Acidimicrobiales bacterium]
MVAPGPIRYARAAGDIDIAYCVFGNGPLDMVVIGGFVTHLDLMWDFPWFKPFLGYGRFCRVITFDKRGTGLSDRSLGFGSLEERSDDIRAVMDAAGSEQAVIFGISEGGPMALYFAARSPERVKALLLYGTAARFSEAPDYPIGMSPELTDTFPYWLEEHWGQGLAYGAFAQHGGAEQAPKLLAPYERSACTPQMARQIMDRNIEIDVRSILPLISAPALVLHCRDDPMVNCALGRYLGEHIPNARFAEIDGDFHASWRIDDQQKFSAPVTDFLSDIGVEATRPPAHRVLSTVLFTDIVGSTEHLSGAGDDAWRETLDHHDRLAAERIERNGGTLIKTTGDGLLATFGGPSDAIAAALAVQSAVSDLSIQIRAGVHTGEVEMRGDDVGGIAVHIGARIAGLASAGEIWVSRTVKDLVAGSGLEFEERDAHDLKGVQGRWELYALAS